MQNNTRFCKDCGKDRVLSYFSGNDKICKVCQNRKYNTREGQLEANPRFTIQDYADCAPLHPVDKYGWKK